MTTPPVTYRGRTALVTGASMGLGAEFARRLAAEGTDLVLVARRTDLLEALAAELGAAHGVATTVISMDLARPESARDLVADLAARSITVDILVNNAGFGTHGDLAAADPDRVAAEIQLNVGTLTGLTARLLPAMIDRGYGLVVNLASTAAFLPLPHMAVYAATKAFVLSFSRALWAETRRTGVRVIAVCPGATSTEFFAVAGEDASVGARRTPQQVVDSAFKAIRAGRPTIVDGAANRSVARVAGHIVPERTLLSAAERSMRARA
jgi:short-subunit dehydrogenase